MNASAILHLNLHRQYFGEIVAKTKRTILEIYDALAESMQTGHPYQTCVPFQIQLMEVVAGRNCPIQDVQNFVNSHSLITGLKVSGVT